MSKKLRKSKNFGALLLRTRLQQLSLADKRVFVSGCVLIVGAALLWILGNDSAPKRIPVPIKLPIAHSQDVNLLNVITPSADYDFLVKQGDTLSGLFQRAEVDQQTMYQVLESDLDVLALDTLMPGNRVKFYLDDQGDLTKLELYFNAAHQVVFSRYAHGGFKYEDIHHEGIWRQRAISGRVQGSFYLSALGQGLTPAEIQRIESLLKDKVNFGRDFRPGDQFKVLLNDQYVEGDPTGESQVIGFSIETAGKPITGFQNRDGQFYDEQGRSLARAFQRLPLAHSYRISSSYNPHRLHPVTGRVSPHNGTDFAVPIGTKVLAPGDGVVALVTNHRYAGRYIVIDHGGKYRTRFLHLSKALVSKGQRVTRGQVIALSGNTGRTTGPHLHYEFMINGRPVNAMKAKIPMAQSLTGRSLKSFENLVRNRKLQMGLS